LVSIPSWLIVFVESDFEFGPFESPIFKHDAIKGQ
jgi:hypothetical protein